MNIFSGLMNPEIIQMGISRQSIEENDISFALKNLNYLIANPSHVLRYSGALSLSVVGYDCDSRELQDIPEVRQYFKALVKAYPYWFHVLNRLDESLLLIFTLSSESSTIAHRGNGSFATSHDPDEFLQFYKRHFGYLESLHQLHNVPEADTLAIGSLVTNYYETKLGVE